MPTCQKWCKHYNEAYGFCEKYKQSIPVSRNPLHYGLRLHPLDYVELYFRKNENDGIDHLVELADKFLTSNIDKGIVKYYRTYGRLSYKQRKVLAGHILYCAEEKPSHEYTVGPYCYQVE